MIAAAVAAVATAASEPVGPRLLVSRSGAIVQQVQDGAGVRPLLGGMDGAWSPDGTLIAFVRGGDLWQANSDGSGVRQLTATVDVQESEPSWSRDGKHLVYTARVGSARQIRLLNLPFGGTHRIAASSGDDWSPVFSPSGRQLAFVSTRSGTLAIYLARADGSGATQVGPPPPPPPPPPEPPPPTDPNAPPPPEPAPEPAPEPRPTDLRDLAFSPGGATLAYTTEIAGESKLTLLRFADRTVTFISPSPAADEQPVWSPDGRRIAFATRQPDGTRVLRLAAADGSGARILGRGAPLDWRVVPLGQPLFPDLAQRPPSGLVVSGARGHWLLGFTSLVDNRGPGILWLRGSRPPGKRLMNVTQLVQLRGGGVRRVTGAGFFRYVVAPPHYHWHVLGFDRYELRSTTDFKLIVRDYKSGFCVADHYGLAPGIRHGPPRFYGNCEQFHRDARFVEQGSSVGYTDRYPAFFHGQNLNLTRVRAGTYWLVHRANSDLGLREPNYSNDAASLLVRIAWPGGPGAAPRVTTLRACRKDRC